jgi:hypothetical protein
MVQPGRGGVVAAGDRTPDELGQHVMFAVEIEVEAAPGHPGGGQDFTHGQVGERPLGQQALRGGQDAFP